MHVLSDWFPGAAHLQNWHPLVVHFPIAFLTVAVFLYALAYGFHQDPWAKLAFGLLVIGTFSAALAAATGLYAQGAIMVAESVRQQLLIPHEHWMLTTLALSVTAMVWAALAQGFPRKGRPVFVLLCFLILAVMAKGADFGGRMVYDYNAGGAACGQPIEFSK